MLHIRPTRSADRAAVLAITRPLVAAADTYAYPPDMTDDALWAYWHPAAGHGFVAEADGAVRGAFVIRPNMPGPGSHIANASYAVHPESRGLGLGRRMGEASLSLAAELGYAALQFNAVVSTNAPAVALWRSLGFAIVGTIPAAFQLPDGRRVDLYAMHRRL